MKGFLITVGIIIGFFLVVVIHHQTHAYSKATGSVVSKALDNTEKAISSSPECYPKEALNVVAVDASKKTVDFIVNKMLQDKFIIVNKDGMSYRFKLVKKYKQPKEKK